MEPAVIYKVAVEDWEYPEIPDDDLHLWRMVDPIWAAELYRYIEKKARLKYFSCPWEWNWVIHNGEPALCFCAYDNFHPVVDKLEDQVTRVWRYLKEERGNSDLESPKWYLNWDPNRVMLSCWRKGTIVQIR